MSGIAPVDTGFIRSSAQEVGNLLQAAFSSQMEEVNTLLSLQAEMAIGAENINSVADTLELNSETVGSNINILA
jgi:hypothetical protein